jgi:hypothetical protein
VGRPAPGGPGRSLGDSPAANVKTLFTQR